MNSISRSIKHSLLEYLNSCTGEIKNEFEKQSPRLFRSLMNFLDGFQGYQYLDPDTDRVHIPSIYQYGISELDIPTHIFLLQILSENEESK